METPILQAPDYLGTEMQQLVVAITSMVAVEKIICFSSTVHRVIKKSCFETEHTGDTIKSTYGLLLIPSDNQAFHESTIQQRAEEAARPIAEVITIVHPIEEVNTALRNGSAFFLSIYKNGTLVYDRNAQTLAEPGEGKPVAARITKREKFWNKWHALAKGFLQGAAFYRTVEQPNLAVYMLHQAAQHCYAGMMRVMTGYRTNSTGLDRLRRLIDATMPYATISLPDETAADLHLTGILLKGYSDARYKDGFEATEQDVAELIDRVAAIIDAADQQCRQRIQQLKTGTATYIG